MPLAQLITAEQLARRLDDPALRILDCRFALEDSTYGERSYRQGHVPGARFADLKRTYLARSPLVSPAGTHCRIRSGWQRAFANGASMTTATWCCTTTAPVPLPHGHGGCCSGSVNATASTFSMAASRRGAKPVYRWTRRSPIVSQAPSAGAPTAA